MKIVALTGGIGSGKSTVAKMFEKLGVPVYYSDTAAKKLMSTSKELKKAIVGLLGEKAYVQNQLNKPYISERIFNDGELLGAFNAIVHPAVRDHFMTWVNKQQGSYVLQESAIVFENGNEDRYDLIILVTAPVDVRMKRVVKRDQSSKELVLERIKNQLPDAKKIPKSDFVIENTELEHTNSKVAEIHRALIGSD